MFLNKETLRYTSTSNKVQRSWAGYNKVTQAAIITEQRLPGDKLCSMDSVATKTQSSILHCKNRRQNIDLNRMMYISSLCSQMQCIMNS